MSWAKAEDSNFCIYTAQTGGMLRNTVYYHTWLADRGARGEGRAEPGGEWKELDRDPQVLSPTMEYQL